MVCGVTDDYYYTLMCDSCLAAFHMFCLVPPLEEVPEGDWQCDQCKEVALSVLWGGGCWGVFVRKGLGQGLDVPRAGVPPGAS